MRIVGGGNDDAMDFPDGDGRIAGAKRSAGSRVQQGTEHGRLCGTAPRRRAGEALGSDQRRNVAR